MQRRDRGKLLEIAHAVKEAGAIGLRGGAFKPRTTPYAFQGLAEEGLKFLAEAREQTGLAIVTEVMSVEQVRRACEYADVLQIGARNMQNFNLLTRSARRAKPVLLKRGMSATLEEFLLAAEYIMARGNHERDALRARHPHVRGIRPQHAAAGDRAGAASREPPAGGRRSEPRDGQELPRRQHVPGGGGGGADGLIIEVHNDPEHAMTDGAQSITPAAVRRR